MTKLFYSLSIKIGSIALAIAITISLFASAIVHADAGCSASTSPNDTTPTSYTNFVLSVNNTGTTDIQWIDITAPTGNYIYTGNSISNWSTADHAGGTTLTGNTLAQGAASDFSVAAITGVVDTSTALWHVQVSPDPSGANPVDCNGSLNTSVSGYPPNDRVNGVPLTQVTDITDV